MCNIISETLLFGNPDLSPFLKTKRFFNQYINILFKPKDLLYHSPDILIYYLYYFDFSSLFLQSSMLVCMYVCMYIYIFTQAHRTLPSLIHHYAVHVPVFLCLSMYNRRGVNLEVLRLLSKSC
jgi:hypothetical protein